MNIIDTILSSVDPVELWDHLASNGGQDYSVPSFWDEIPTPSTPSYSDLPF